MVGVDLQDAEENRALTEAIEDDNPEATLRPGCPGLMKLQTPRRAGDPPGDCGDSGWARPWETHEFQLSIVSYSGNIAEWDDDQIIIKWEH